MSAQENNNLKKEKTSLKWRFVFPIFIFQQKKYQRKCQNEQNVLKLHYNVCF